MKEISINGVEYLPASVLAKEFKYTTDYIGQLCRGKKVDAQLIGRSWYVNPLSLKNHKKSRYINKSNESRVSSNNDIFDEEDAVHEVKLSRVAVEPVVSKATVRMSQEAEKNFAKRMDWKPLRYESDGGDLLPNLKSTPAPKMIHLELAESTDIAIKTSTKPTLMEAEPLPVVSLKGKLKIDSLDENLTETLTETSEEVFLMDIPLPEQELPREIKRPALHHSLPVFAQKQNQVEKARFVGTSVKTTASFTPESVKSDLIEDEESYRVFKITLMTTSGILVASLLMLIFGESVTYADTVSYQTGVSFTTESLTALVALFSS